jgi:hypothetical protein
MLFGLLRAYEVEEHGHVGGVPTPNPQSKKDTNVVELNFICLLNLVEGMSKEQSVRTHFVNLSDKLSFVDSMSKRNRG